MLRPGSWTALAAIIVATIFAVPSSSDAQLGSRLKKRAEDAAKAKLEQRAGDKAGQATDKVLDAAEKKVTCAVNDTACAEKAKAEGKTVVIADTGSVKPGAAATASAGDDINKMKPGEGAWANYDFKPGERILFYDDFMKDEVGDFPRRMEFQSGALEIVEWNGGRWLRASEDSRWFIPLPEVRPDRFTMEFDFFIPSGVVWIYVDDEQSGKRVDFGGTGGAWLTNTKAQVHASFQGSGTAKMHRGRVMIDGKYAKVYVDDRRVLNVPNADFGHTNKILFFTDGVATEPTLFGNFRFAAGGKKLYDALAESGRVATQGIYFDTGSDRIRPESSPTLKEIAAMLTEHADLRLTIEGHTDNVGNVASNQTLSEKRAAAVKAALESAYGVDAARLEAKGLGATKPASSNDTPEGRQNNRRVELVKM
jgi:OmpA-OmpF porin, OOP family